LKTFKQLLCFIIPFVVSAGLLLVLYLPMEQSEPKFISNENYLRLLLNDSVFLTAIFNTFCVSLLIGLFAAAILAAVRFFTLKFVKSKRLNRLFSPLSVVVTSVVIYSVSIGRMISVVGFPSENYTAQTILLHLTDTASIRPNYFNFPLLLLSVLPGSLFAFFIWIIDRIFFKKLKQIDK